MGLGHSRASQAKRVGHWMAHPPRSQGTPCRGPRQPLSTMPFDGLTCLEGQTTSESYETRTVASISKIASQRFKNHIDPTSPYTEIFRSPKDARRKRRIDDAWPSPEPPSRGARLWGLAIAEPRKQRGLAIGWPTLLGARGPPAGDPDSPFRRCPSTV